MVEKMKKPNTPAPFKCTCKNPDGTDAPECENEKLWAGVRNIKISVNGVKKSTELYANGLNMCQVTVKFDLLRLDGKTMTNLAGTICQTALNNAVKLIDFNDEKKIFPKLIVCPTLHNPTPLQEDGSGNSVQWDDGFAYTETPNEFYSDPSGSASNLEDSDPENLAVVTFYVLCKGDQGSGSIGVQIQPTAIGSDLRRGGSNEEESDYVEIVKKTKLKYDFNKVKINPFTPEPNKSTDIWNETGSTPIVEDYWRQINFTIELGGYSGAILASIGKYKPSNCNGTPESVCTATKTSAGYSTDLYIWSFDEPENVSVPVFFATTVDGVHTKYASIKIGVQDNTVGVRATLIFRACTQYGSRRAASPTAISIYDRWGNGLTAFANPELPTYVAAKVSPHADATIEPNTYNPFYSGTSEDWAPRACTLANENGHTMWMSGFSGQRVVCSESALKSVTSFQFHLDPRNSTKLYFQLLDVQKIVIAYTGNEDGKNQSAIMQVLASDTNHKSGGSVEWTTFYYIKPIWESKQFAISAASSNHLLKASNELLVLAPGNEEVYAVQTDNLHSQINLPDLPGFMWSIKAVEN